MSIKSPADEDGLQAVVVVECSDVKGFAPEAGRCLKRFFGEWCDTQLSPNARHVAHPIPVRFLKLRRKRGGVEIDLAYRLDEFELSRRELRKALADRVWQAFSQPEGGISGFTYGGIEVHLPEPATLEEEIEDENDESLSDDGDDYSGAMCGECGESLDRNGYCKNRRCPHQDYLQDEPIPDSVRRKLEQVIGNSRSKRAYAYGTAGYRRNVKSQEAVVFSSDTEAERAGYEVQDE